jgi:hypothetical protein
MIVNKILQTFLSTTTTITPQPKKVSLRPDYSKFKKDNYAASDHAGLGDGQELS